MRRSRTAASPITRGSCKASSTPDGKPILNEKGEPVVSQTPKVHRDLRFDFEPEQIELARRGLWKVVNEGGGTGGRARLPDVAGRGQDRHGAGDDRRQEGHDRLVRLLRALRQAEVYRSR